MAANILLGTAVSKFKCEFNKRKFFCGLFKAFCIIVACILMYLCGILNPNLVVTNIGGINMNLSDAMKTIFIAGIVMYAVKDLIKIKELMGVSMDIASVEGDNSMVQVPIENNIKGDKS